MVASYVQLLQKRYNDKLSKEANEFIDFAVQGSNRMKDLLNDLLIYSRLNTKDEDVIIIDMGILFSNLLKKLETQIIKSNAEINLDCLMSVEGKYNQIFLLFENLISNGIKFNNNEKKEIKITSKLEGKSIIYSVKDNGIGISEGFYDKIFNIFQRLHSYNEYHGTGIGLALCKKIISNHNGNIRVESIPGLGSTFFVEFKTNNE
jgi:light-regulated signal transduction histidine kinase (bacteriophytochrome)